MTITASLLFVFAATLVLGGWTLIVGIRRAAEGYESELGYCAGQLPASPQQLFQPKPAQVAAPASAAASVAAAGESSTAVSAQSVTIFVSRGSRLPSPLYRRQHRSGASASPFVAGSAAPFPSDSSSPFEIQYAAARERVTQTDGGSTPPIPVSTKPASSQGTKA
jgi:hypothetical protein